MEDRLDSAYWRRIDKIILHKGFQGEALSWKGYDLALLKLETQTGHDVPEGTIRPVCLAVDGFDDKNNGSLFMAGYGRRRIPHCLTNTLGPEKFQVCGRERECSKDHRARSCSLEFLDDNG